MIAQRQQTIASLAQQMPGYTALTLIIIITQSGTHEQHTAHSIQNELSFVVCHKLHNSDQKQTFYHLSFYKDRGQSVKRLKCN